MPRPLALLAVLALAGCGSHAAAERPADAQIAHGVVLALLDLPDGWQRAGAGGAGDADCPSFAAAEHAATAVARSGPFVRDGGRRELSSSAFVFARPATARSEFARMSSPATRSCYASRIRSVVGKVPGARQLRVVDGVTRVDPLGDEQSGARFVAGYTHGGRRMVAYVDLLIVRTGRGIATEAYTSSRAPLDGGLRYNLTALTARRLADAVG